MLEILSNASAVIAEGEVLQLITANDTDTTEQAYLEVIAAKTGGPVRGRLPDRRRGRRAARGRGGGARQPTAINLGIAFQLIDDMLDYSAEQAELGKSVGDDFREGKMTLPVLLAFAAATRPSGRFWRRMLEQVEQPDGRPRAGQELLARHGAIDDTVARARHYGASARERLAASSPTRRKSRPCSTCSISASTRAY